MASFLNPLLRSGGASLALTNTRHNRVVARTLLPAFDSKSRRQGLLQHASLPHDSALIIAPSNAIHTFSMRFMIDVAFVARDGRVLKLRRHMPPRRITAAWRGFAVIELAAGALERTDTRVGDRLQIAAASSDPKSCLQVDESAGQNQRISPEPPPKLGDDSNQPGIVARLDVAGRHRRCSG